MPKKEDRRVRITKLAIKDSLIELMLQYPISKISVKMICDNADINRSTFYSHYKDQRDLLDKVQQEAVYGIKNYIFSTSFTQQADTAAPTIIKVLEYCRDNRELFKVILSENGDTTFQRELMILAQEKAIDEIREDERLDTQTSKYLELFALSGILSMLRQWLIDGCIDEPADLAGLITKFLYEGIFGLFNDSLS
ncbi:MAG: TetR-like C-terminal domain-containing protein [Lachnospiraceae bacterium]